MAEVGRSAVSEQEREVLRKFFGNRADGLLDRLDRENGQRPPQLAAAPRDAGKFVRQLAALYCEDSELGLVAQDLIRGILKNAMQLVNLISEANPGPKP